MLSKAGSLGRSPDFLEMILGYHTRPETPTEGEGDQEAQQSAQGPTGGSCLSAQPPGHGPPVDVPTRIQICLTRAFHCQTWGMLTTNPFKLLWHWRTCQSSLAHNPDTPNLKCKCLYAPRVTVLKPPGQEVPFPLSPQCTAGSLTYSSHDRQRSMLF